MKSAAPVMIPTAVVKQAMLTLTLSNVFPMSPKICQLTFERTSEREISSDGKKGWRLDYDPKKGMHINVFDYTKGKGDKAIKEVIPFNGNKDDFNRYLKQLNK